MKVYKLFICLFLCVQFVVAQEKDGYNNSYIQKAELAILEKKTDSVPYFLNQSKLENLPYVASLKRIANQEANYKDYYDFIERIIDRYDLFSTKLTSDFIETSIKEPSIKNGINLEYVKIYWLNITFLREDTKLDLASKFQEKLDQYIAKFNNELKEVKKAKIYASIHPIVMFQIQKKVAEGKALCLENLELAKNINDKKAQVMLMYHLADFLLLERKLLEYIKVSEESLTLEKQIEEGSPYDVAIIENLINAYIFKGNSENRIDELIEELEAIKYSENTRYLIYMKYLATLPNNSTSQNKIFNKLKVKTLPAFSSKIEQLLEGKINPNQKLQFYTITSNTLQTKGFLNEALHYSDKSVLLVKEIYSKDLAETLADYKTAQAIKQKELELTYEKEKARLTEIIAIVVGVSLIIVFLILLRIRHQSKQLKEKNSTIKRALAEKELLIKEVHHRVKNNFQIVSSLLELQSKGIEDEKALELANQGKSRVKSMALIHQKLYQNETGLVNFDEYIHLLVNELNALYASDKKVNTKITSENMNFDVDTAIPLGLIINEIITNSYKYAFRNDKENNLNISIQKQEDKEFKLTIEDNGPGLSEAIDKNQPKTLGLRLIKRLVKQLQGQLLLTSENGTRFEILFKDFNTRKLIN